MFAYLILGVALLIAVYFLARWFATSSPSTLATWLKWLFLGLGGAATAYFAVTGKIYLALIPLALTVLPRILSLFMAGGGYGGQPSGGQASEVETSYIRMTLEHDTGDMRGVVLRGRYAGQELSTLSEAQLMELLFECRQQDTQAARLLETYLDRTLEADWRQRDTDADRASHGAGSEHRAGGRPADRMTREEAYDILGLKPEASQEDIRRAHHQLMLKIHPDQGGSNYLAAQINQAKDVLLGDD